MLSYKEAALKIGCTHHYVRMLTSRGQLQIAERVEVRPNVLKVYLTEASVDRYIEDHKQRHTLKLRVTEQEERAVRKALREVRRNGSNW